jgi:DNA-binding response OmpR family regulator
LNQEHDQGDTIMPIALVLEDDEIIRSLFRFALEHAEFTVLTAGSVNEAIQVLETQTPDIAFIDVNMPERPGTDLLAHIKATARFADIKTVVVTAQTRSESRVEELGADLFLLKPVSIKEMTTLARRLVRMGETSASDQSDETAPPPANDPSEKTNGHSQSHDQNSSAIL